MRSVILLVVVATLAAAARVKHEGDDTLYLVDFGNNGRPKYLDETPEGAKSAKALAHPGLILINNPLKDREARADGIYFRPENGKDLDPTNEKVSFYLFVYFERSSWSGQK